MINAGVARGWGPVDAVEEVLRRVAAHGLPGAPPIDEVADPAVASWERVLEGADRERLWGLVADAISLGQLPGLHDPQAAAHELRFTALAHTLPLEALLERTVSVLGGAGIPTRVLKGAAVAHLDYPDPGLRSYVDVDVLVPADCFDKAVAVMVAEGHGRRGLPQRRPGYDRRFGKDVTFITSTGRGIDLHRTLTFGPFGLGLPLNQLWREGQTFQFGAQKYLSLPPVERFLSVCVHAALGGMPARLVPLRDVAQMAMMSRIDVSDVRLMAEEWGLEVVLARALVLTEDILGVRLGELGEWAQQRPQRSWERRALRPYLTNHGPGLERASETWKHVHGMIGKLRYIHGQLFPSRIYLAGRYEGYRSYWGSHTRKRSRVTADVVSLHDGQAARTE
jgi:hypothetical protein